ncbi:hypothetical protein DFJ58DRAFT_662446 [Suillus subalutaceus]|uniref:uncharacterized protein n=1 Tax=Suillus subalutaceus TaxID=48586 RepID=UPI001B873CD7|nr:uncharacterized protein DFJ58DRAFT_662446 [Suillus subalutaceus]KAG1849288.1 hypothetical protein DFJ58DRAFT_662446 [Suillus subalutaceus]
MWRAKLNYFLDHGHQYLEACVERTPDIFPHEELQSALRDARGTNVSLQTIEKTLRSRGFTRKNLKLARLAAERNEIRNIYLINVAEDFCPDQLVFVDESACNRITTRRQMTWSSISFSMSV